MRVLVGCEFSGVVRDAFRARGHNAWSCDLLATEREGPHIFGDVLEAVTWGWDLAIFHPPCTALCRAGDRWYRQSAERQQALEFVQALYAAPVPRIAIENPRGLNRFLAPGRSGHPAVDVRPRRDEGDVPVAEEPAAAAGHRGQVRARAARVLRRTWAGSLEGTQPNAGRSRECDG